MRLHSGWRAWWSLSILTTLILAVLSANAAINTVTYQVTASVDDGYAWTSIDQDTAGAYLNIGDDTYSAPYHTAAMRFASINIPRSATITGASLKIYSANVGNKFRVYGLINAEAADDPADFAARNIASVVKTTASTPWNHDTNWADNTWYTSPDISTAVQEVIDRPGYSSGNALALIYSTSANSNKYRQYASYDLSPTYAPTIEITYEYYTISGYVTIATATPIEGVSIDPGSDIESTSTDPTGYYEIKVPANWTGTVTVSKPDWGFTPWSTNYTNVTADQINQNYTAFQPVISGNTGTDAVTLNGLPGNPISDPSGLYSATVPYGWSGTVTPTKTGFNITPSPRVYSNVTADLLNEDYTAYQPTVSGNTAAPNVILNGLPGTPISDPSGFYSAIVSYGWSGTVTPTRLGWDITPQTLTYTNVITDQTNQDFSAVYVGIIVNTDGTGDFIAIQPAIDAAIVGDTVIVHPGTYYENINFGGKDIILTSTNPNDPNLVAATIIDANGSGTVVTFSGTETSDCLLTGFTITGGNSSGGGGFHSGYSAGYSEAAIENCVISGNTASYGGGIYSCNGAIRNCTISGNTAGNYGGGLYGCYGTISNCTISGNTAVNTGGGLDFCGGSITNTIIWGNVAASQSQMYDCSTPNYSCIQDWAGGGVGNISADPLLLADGFHISLSSPCINTGDENMIVDPNATDVDGNPRFVGRIDMGVDEVYSETTPLIVLQPKILTFTALSKTDTLAPQNLTISNIGLPDLNWNASDDGSWLQTNISSGTLSFEATEEVILAVDLTGLDNGLHTSHVTFTDPIAGNTPQTVTVNLDILRPQISVSTSLFYFDASIDDPNGLSDVFSIFNSGYDTLNWQIDIPPQCTWLTVDPLTGQSNGENNDVTLTVDATALNYGRYFADLTVTDPDASNSPQIITVELHAYKPGEIHVPAEYTTLWDAVMVAFDGDHVIVHPGTYSGSGNRNIFMDKPITVRSIDPSDPNIVANTIISDSDQFQYNYKAFIFDFSFGEPDAVLDGFTITGFNVTPIECQDCSPTIRNCVIKENTMARTSSIPYAGAIIGINASPVIQNCVITRNSSEDHSTMSAAILIFYDNYPEPEIKTVIENCLISHNESYDGAGIYCINANMIIKNSTIAANRVIDTFNGWTYGVGGGLLAVNSEVQITDSIFYGNTAPHANEIAIASTINSSGIPSRLPDVTISHSDIKDPNDNILLIPDWWTYYFYEKGYIDPNAVDPNMLTWATGNINAVPLFVQDPNDGGDSWADDPYTSEDESANNTYGDFHLLSTSPCINAGNPGYITDPNDTDLDAKPRVIGSAVDMGSYEFSYPGDFQHDGKVDARDFAIFSQAFSSSPSDPAWNPRCDIATPPDNYIGTDDLAAFLRYWLETIL